MSDWTDYADDGDQDVLSDAELEARAEPARAEYLEQQQAAELEHGRIVDDQSVLAGLPDGVMPDGTSAPQCLHPPTARVRDEDGTQVCTDCGDVVVLVDSTAVAIPSSGTVETFDVGQGVLEHLPWPPGPNVRPYTPEDVEHELVAMTARLNSGARYEARITRELGQAEHEYDLAYATALLESEKRSKEMREADAKLRCREQWDRLAQLRTDYKVTRAGMHTLRAQLNAMQTVNASVRIASGGGR